MISNVEEITGAFHAVHTTAEMLHKHLEVEASRGGPKHKETWTISIKLDGVVYHGCGLSEKAAKQQAAINVLKDTKNQEVREGALRLSNASA
ncbi:hypothetical protein BJ165DRAFT_1533670 [Panaeolus papilionaceus]|nr:hypothetical protein BJ165DRAFT_1533670 [Panaeolus papilionaceus]